MKLEPFLKLGAALMLLISFAIAGHFDAEDAQAQRDQYCEMVAIWKAEAARGVPPADRAGWPPFDGECND